MTLIVAVFVLWGILAIFTSFDLLPIWTPLLLGVGTFVLALMAPSARRALAAILGGSLLLGGVSLWVQTDLTKPTWLVEAAARETSGNFQLEILNRPKVIYKNFDQSAAYGVAVSLQSIDESKATGRGYLIFDGIQLARGEVISLEATLEPAGRNSRDAFLIRAPPEIQIVSKPNLTQGLLNQLRSNFVKNLSGVTPDARSLVAGLAIGEISELSAELQEKMLVVSLTHLVAVSGSNCAIVVGMVYLIAVGLRFGRFGRTVISLSALVFYILLIGPDPSVLRAGVMAASVILMIALGRRSWAINALAIAAIVLLIADPWLAVEFGFGLSVLATAGILVLAPAMAERFARHMPMPLALGLSVTMAAQLFCLPLLMQLQPGLPTYSVIANLLAGPMVAPVTVLGMIALTLTPIAPFLVGTVSYLASFGTWIIEVIAITFSELPVAYFPWATGLPATILSIILIIAVASWLRAGLIPMRQIGVAGVVVIAVTTLSVPAASEILPKSWPVGNWSVVACDVGQGDALVIKSLGRVALIDVGPDEEKIDSCLVKLGVETIDLLVLTHFDFDHVGGLIGAIKSRNVSTAIVSGFPDTRPATINSLDTLEDRGVKVIKADPAIGGLLGEFTWKILAPTSSALEADDSNDASVVMVFKSSQFDLLLLGDLGEPGQQRVESAVFSELASSTKPLILKVSHHGSNDQSAEFHEKLRPELSLISVGADNGYGHPGKSLLDLLERSGSKVLRTDQLGSISVGIDSQSLSFAGSG